MTLFYSYKISWPSITPRNFIITSFHFIVTTVLFLYAFEDILIYNALGYFFWLAPFIAFVTILTGVVLTQIPVQIYRFIIVQTARLKIRHSKTLFVGVTGSYGKTAIVNYLHSICSKKFTISMTDSRYTNDIGIARAILRNLTDDIEVFIIEIGSYRKGEIYQAVHHIPFSYLIISGVGNHRVDLFRSKRNMYDEFTSLITRQLTSKTVYLNSEIQLKDYQNATVLRYGFTEKDDISATHCKFNQSFTTARLHYKNHSWNLRTALLGKHSLQNLLPVFALCMDLGMKSTEVLRGIQDLKHEKSKFTIHRGLRKSVVISDLQESNLNGLLLKIDYLKNFSHKRKLVVSKGIRELGVEKRSSYREIVNKLNKNETVLFTTDAFFNENKKHSSIVTFNDVLELQNHVLSSLDRHTVLLVEGRWPPSLIEAIIIRK